MPGTLAERAEIVLEPIFERHFGAVHMYLHRRAGRELADELTVAVHTGARVAAQARAGEVLVSSTVKDLVAGAAIAFADRGVHELKGVPGQWQCTQWRDPPREHASGGLACRAEPTDG